MVRNGETGFLVAPDDLEHAVSAVEQILRDDELASRMESGAREAARERFHPDRVAERTRLVYQRAVEGRGTPLRTRQHH